MITSGMERMLPNSTEAEQGVLGCALLAPSDVMPVLMERYKEPDIFYDLKHRVVYSALVHNVENGRSLDLIGLRQTLTDWGKLEAAGGMAYISSLPDAVPSAANLDYYLDIVNDKWTSRQLIKTCTKITAQAYDWDDSGEKLLDQAEENIFKVQATHQHSSCRGMPELVDKTIASLERMIQGGTTAGLATGFDDLDNMTGGMMEGEMIVLAARPSVGKTSLAINIASNLVWRQIPVGVLSLEMRGEELTRRIIAARTKINSKKFRNGSFDQEELQAIITASAEIKKQKLFIDDERGIDILQLCAKARRMKQRFGIRVLVIDYLQLIVGTKHRQNRAAELAEITTGIKNLAGNLGIPIIVLSQLNRDSDKEERAPRISDLRDSGSIEQDADQVWLLWVPNTAPLPNGAVGVELRVGKMRNCETGSIKLPFHKQWTLFTNPEPETMADVVADTKQKFAQPSLLPGEPAV